MADQFVWEQWTPTFALVRERTIWLAARAARLAAAFGEFPLRLRQTFVGGGSCFCSNKTSF
jgi:hypothetical protein